MTGQGNIMEVLADVNPSDSEEGFAVRKENCPAREKHTPEPMHESDYMGWHAWARRMSKTHKQRRCPECGLFAIWVPRTRRLRAVKPRESDKGRRRP